MCNPDRPTENVNQMSLNSQGQGFVHNICRQFWLSLKEKGPRFFCVAVVANLTGIAVGFILFKSLTPLLSIALVSAIGGVLHVFITYSSHYYFTFRKPGNYLKGLWKVYVTAWFGMLVSSFLNQFLIGTLKMPYFVAAAMIFCFGASYSVVVNFLFVFRRPSS